MDVTEILTSLGTPEGRADPYPLYAALHEIGDVIEFGPRDVLVAGYDTINAVLRDPGFRCLGRLCLRPEPPVAGGRIPSSCRAPTGS